MQNLCFFFTFLFIIEEISQIPKIIIINFNVLQSIQSTYFSLTHNYSINFIFLFIICEFFLIVLKFNQLNFHYSPITPPHVNLISQFIHLENQFLLDFSIQLLLFSLAIHQLFFTYLFFFIFQNQILIHVLYSEVGNQMWPFIILNLYFFKLLIMIFIIWNLQFIFVFDLLLIVFIPQISLSICFDFLTFNFLMHFFLSLIGKLSLLIFLFVYCILISSLFEHFHSIIFHIIH